MPIYEYLCAACGHEFEVIQKVSEGRLRKCPECRKSALKKKVSAGAFRLSGSGWYETDFKTGNKKNIAGESNSPPDGGNKSASSDTAAKAGESKGGDTKGGDNKGASTTSADSKSKPDAAKSA